MLSTQASAARRTLKSLLLSALLVSPMAMAAYPDKPIQLIVPWLPAAVATRRHAVSLRLWRRNWASPSTWSTVRAATVSSVTA